MAKRIAAILAVCLLFAGCASKNDERYARDGVQYGTTKGTFRGRWWSYYERGTSYAAGKYYAEATKDFETALQGRAKDTWRARTYGLHFVEYFPNRELGVTYFEQGKLEEAERLLTASLAQTDTERAHYYLDMVKKARLANGSLKDETSPEIDTTIDQPTTVAANEAPAPAPTSRIKLTMGPAGEPLMVLASAKYFLAEAAAPTKVETVAAPAKPAKGKAKAPATKTTSPAAKAAPAPTKPAAPEAPLEKPKNLVTEPVVPIQVAANDDVGVVKVMVNGKQTPQRGSAQQLKFRDDVQVKEGAQKIEVVATDLADKQTTKNVEVTVDLTGPTIGVFSPIEPTVTPDGAVNLDGASVDKVGVAAVAVGDRRIADSPGVRKLPFNTQLALGNGENVFVLAAKDVGGNETRSAVKVFRGDPNSREAKLWLLKQKRPDLFLFASNGTGDLDELLRVAQNQAGKKRVNEIVLKSPSIDKPYRHNRTLRISGDVFTSSAVQSLTINGEPVNEISGAPKESFNKRIAIDPKVLETGGGKLDVSIVATTTKGETFEKKFTVDLSPVDMTAPESRMPVAVLAFAGVGVDAGVAESLRAATQEQISAQKRFRALGRTELQGALNEQQLASAFGNPDEAISVGKAAGAQLFLVGDLFPLDANGIEIKVRAVDPETGDLIATLDAFVPDRGNAELVQLKCRDLAEQLARLYPRLSGEVTAVSGNDVTLSWTAEDGLRTGAYVILYQQTPAWTDPATGEVIEPGEMREAGRARVVSVSPSGVHAVTIERKEEGAPVEQGMPAITM